MSNDLKCLVQRLQNRDVLKHACFIGGRWVNEVENNLDDTIAVTNPSTQKIIGYVPNLGKNETYDAIDKAQNAFISWKAETAATRAGILRKWYDLIIENTEDLAIIMTAEQGKPLAEARGEITYAASFVAWFASEAERMYGATIPTHAQDKRILTIKEPVGVVAAITPWNFPAAMLTRKAAPALAAGCTVIAKPALQTPFSALALAELARQAGVPDGVLSVITGDAEEIGQALTESSLVRKLSFTGSTEIGKLLMRQCAGTIKRLSLELGGNAPFIVFDDADIDAAVEGAMAAKFRNAGQTCVCANRFYVHKNIYANFSEKLGLAIKSLRVGDGFKEGVDQGPLIDDFAMEKVEVHIQDAVAKGASLVCGGVRFDTNANFISPALLCDVTQDMLVTREETFGPVAALIKFDTEAEVIAMANDTPFGLAAYFYTNDSGRVWRISEALEAGMVGVNTGLISTTIAPFGGVKQSGLGREGGSTGIDEYLETKYICIGGVSAL